MWAAVNFSWVAFTRLSSWARLVTLAMGAQGFSVRSVEVGPV